MIICQDRLGTDVGKALKKEHFVEQAVAWVRLDISGGADGGGRGVNLTVQIINKTSTRVAVRKKKFLEPVSRTLLYIKTVICQDRLVTNVRKTQETMTCSAGGNVSAFPES